LSERRAKAVRDALVAEGVPADSIGSWGYGEGELAVWTDDNVRERMNRRVEIIFE
jgi:OOP family OmpA-OmpF porin